MGFQLLPERFVVDGAHVDAKELLGCVSEDVLQVPPRAPPGVGAQLLCSPSEPGEGTAAAQGI